MTRPERSRLDEPTAENSTDTSTPSASGLTGGSPAGTEPHQAADEDVVRRDIKRRDDMPPRRYEQPSESDPVMPADDPALNTKI